MQQDASRENVHLRGGYTGCSDLHNLMTFQAESLCYVLDKGNSLCALTPSHAKCLLQSGGIKTRWVETTLKHSSFQPGCRRMERK